jgi:hypothetical protein
VEYRECADAAAVVLYTLSGGGHSWPGGKPPPSWRVGATNTSIDATAEMWEFFVEHPLRGTRSANQRRPFAAPRGDPIASLREGFGAMPAGRSTPP